MIDRIAHAVLNAIAPTVHATIQKELAALFGSESQTVTGRVAPAKKTAIKKSAPGPGRPRKHKQEEGGAVPEPNSQAGMILSLLSKGTRSGTELADGSGLTTRQVHSNLQSLRKRHLVVTKGRGQYALANGVSP
jgi:biotin operon repressor